MKAPGLLRRIARAQQTLAAIYDLEVDVRAERFVIPPERARSLLDGPGPRSGVLVVEDSGGDGAQLGLYIDPADARDPGTIVEETSHLLCLAWHAAQGRPVSRLILELQGEVDRWVVARLEGRDAFDHFRGFRWDGWMSASDRHRYEAAHAAGHRYCRALDRRYPRRSHTPGLLRELRRFYRAPSEHKLRAAGSS